MGERGSQGEKRRKLGRGRMAKAGEGGFVCMPCDGNKEKWRFNDPLLSTGLLWFEPASHRYHSIDTLAHSWFI